MTHSISYATPQAQKPISRWWFRAALIGALTPMVLGTAVIALWLTTYSKLFVTLGGWTFSTGLVLFALGSVSLLVHGVLSMARGAKGWVWRTAIVFILLLGNFPLCATYIHLAQAWRVRVINQSTSVVKAFTIVHPSGRTTVLADIPPGGSDSARFFPDGEGAISFSATGGTTVSSGTLTEYTTSMMEGQGKDVTFNADGTVTVQ